MPYGSVRLRIVEPVILCTGIPTIMRLFRRRNGARRQAFVEMTPLIDMVFILLIFFIVATSFVREAGVAVNKPESSNARGVGDGFVLVAITRAGTVHLGGAAISPNDAEDGKARRNTAR